MIDHVNNLKTDFAMILEDEEFSDVVFVLDGDRRFHAHRTILAARSEYYRKMFQTAMRESSEKEIRLKETPEEAFKALLRYLYTGEVDFTSMELDTVVDLFQTADKYLCDDLKKEINSFHLENIVFFLKAPFIHCIPSFLEECLQFVDRNAPEFLRSTDFKSLDTDTLVLILQRESFYAKEEEIFDAVVSWIDVNSDLSNAEHKRILDNVRLDQIPLEKVQKIVGKSDLLTERVIRGGRPRTTSWRKCEESPRQSSEKSLLQARQLIRCHRLFP